MAALLIGLSGTAGGLIGSLFTAALALLGMIWKQRRDERLAQRVTSGTVETSQAAELWQAAEQLRHELRDELERVQETVAALREEADRYKLEAEECNRRAAGLVRRVAELERLVAEFDMKLTTEEGRGDSTDRPGG